MSLTNLMFGAPVKVALGTSEPGVGLIEFDCSESETHISENEITDHPVEDRSLITDHIRVLPDGFEIHGLVSDTPIVYLATVFGASPVKVNPNASQIAFDDRKEEAYTKLRELKNKGILIDAVTSLRTYRDVTIQSLSISRNAETGRVLDCTITLREIQKSSSLVLTAPTPTDVANNAAEHRGKLNKKDGKTKQIKQGQSMLSKITGLFGG